MDLGDILKGLRVKSELKKTAVAKLSPEEKDEYAGLMLKGEMLNKEFNKFRTQSIMFWCKVENRLQLFHKNLSIEGDDIMAEERLADKLFNKED